MANEKVVTFLLESDLSDSGKIILGGIGSALAYLKAEMEEMKDGDASEFVVERHDMFPSEIEDAPVI